MRLTAAAALTVAATLALAAPALAHVTAVPTFLGAGQRGAVTLVAPNEREEAMTGLSITVPTGLSIVEAVPPGAGWQGAVEGATATWTGGSLPAGTVSSFSLVLDASGDPGDVTLDTRQLYPGDEEVRWPVAFTILPGSGSAGSSSTVLVVVMAIGLLLIATLGAVVWLRRSRPSEEG